MNNTENSPLGAYPQFLLCGQAGIAPTNIKTNRTNKIVPNVILPPVSFNCIYDDRPEAIEEESG